MRSMSARRAAKTRRILFGVAAVAAVLVVPLSLEAVLDSGEVLANSARALPDSGGGAADPGEAPSGSGGNGGKGGIAIGLWQTVIGGVLAAVLTPLIGWYLEQRGASGRSRALQDLLRRTELVERLLAVHEQGSSRGSAYRAALQAEAADILADLEALRDAQRLAGAPAPAGMPRMRRWLLLYKQGTWGASVYRGVFYTFLFFAAVTLVGGWFWYTGPEFPGVTGAATAIGGGMAYLFLALLSRAAAVRRHKRALDKIEASEADAAPN